MSSQQHMPNGFKNLPLYRVSVQRAPGEEIQIRNMRCKDIAEVGGFVRRLYNIISLSHLSLYEVALVENVDGKGETLTFLVGDPNKQWPAVHVRKLDGIMVPKIPRLLPQEIEPPPQEIKTQPAATPAATPKPGIVASVTNAISKIAGSADAQPAKVDERGRPRRRFYYKVA